VRDASSGVRVRGVKVLQGAILNFFASFFGSSKKMKKYYYFCPFICENTFLAIAKNNMI